MEQHTCKTYFAVKFDFDDEKNVELLKERRTCSPEEIGIFNKDEVEKFILDNFGVTPIWNRHHFVIGSNSRYSSEVSEMLCITLKDLFGKEEKIKEMQKMFSVTCVLEIVPTIVSGSEKPSQNLSLNSEIIDFLYNSDTVMDLDYYVI